MPETQVSTHLIRQICRNLYGSPDILGGRCIKDYKPREAVLWWCISIIPVPGRLSHCQLHSETKEKEGPEGHALFYSKTCYRKSKQLPWWENLEEGREPNTAALP